MVRVASRIPFTVRRAAVAVAVVLAILAGGTVGFFLLGAGAWPWSDCAYMTAITVSTVGFREVIPIGNDPILRAYTVLLILAGTGSMLYLLSIVTAFVVEGDLNQFIRRRRMEREIGGMGEHYVVCGIGRSGEHAAERLLARGVPLVLVDRSEEAVRAFLAHVGARVPYVVGDATDEDVLRRAGVDRARGLIAALPEDQDNIYLILSVRSLNRSARVVSKYNEKRSRQKLLQVGADSVVSPTAMGGLRMFSEMVQPGVMSFLDDVLHETGEDLSIEELAVGRGSKLDGRRLVESGIRERTNLLVVGVREPDTRKFTYNPGPDLLLVAGMTLIVVGPPRAFKELVEMADGSGIAGGAAGPPAS